MANNIANLGVQVSMDLDPLKQSTATLKSMLTSNNKALKNHERAFKDSSMGAKDLADREKVLSKQIETSAQYVEKKKEELDNLKKSIGNVNDATDKQKKQLLNANSALSTAQHELSGYRNQLSSVQSKQANMSRSTTDLQSELRDLQLTTKITASEQRKSGDAAGALETEYKGLGRQTQLYNMIIAKEKDKLAELRKTKGDDARETQNQERNVSKLMKEQGSLITQQDKVADSLEDMNNKSKRTGKGFNDMWAVFKGSFLAQGVMRILDSVIGKFKELFSGAILRVDKIDSATKALTTLTGSSDGAAKAMKAVERVIEGTPIAMDSMTNSVKGLVASGMEIKDVEGVLRATTDAAYGLGDGEQSIDQIVGAFKGLQASGTASLEDLNRLVDANIPAIKILANQYGVSVTDMKKQISDGQIKSSDAIRKLVEGMEEGTKGSAGATQALKGQAKTAGDTIQGSFNNMNTAIIKTMTSAINPFKDDIINMFKGMTSSLKSAGKVIEPFLEGLANKIKTLNPNIKIGAAIFAGLGVAAGVAAVAVGALAAAFSFLMSPAALIAGAVAAIGTGFVIAYTKSETFRNVVNNVFKSVAGAVQPAIQAVKGFFQLFKGNGQDGVITLSKIFPPNLVVGITNTVNVIKRTVMQVFTAVSTFGQQIGSYLRTFWNQNGTMIMQAVSNIGKAISFVMTKVIWPIMKFIWPAVRYLIVSTWSAIKGTISGALKVITGVIKVFAALFTGNWKALWSGVKQIAKGALQFLFNAAQLCFVGRIFGVGKLFSKLFGGKLLAMWKSISGFFTKYGSKIWKTTSAFFTRIYNSVKKIFTSTKSFISTTWNLIAKILANTVGRIFKNTTAKFTALSNKVKSTITSLKNGLIDRFTSIKKNLTNLVEGVRSAVVDKFHGMYKGATSWIGKIKQFIIDAKDGFKKEAKKLGNSIANGAINGLNAMIDGINSLSDKIMSKKLIKKKIPTLSTGTGFSPQVETDSNGLLKRGTKAIVNDRGPGNGTGPNGHKELIYRRSGKIERPIGNNKKVNLRRGDGVFNGAQSQSLLPHLSTGTVMDRLFGSGAKGSKKKAKDKKKWYEKAGENIGDAWDSTKDFGKEVATTTGKGIKSVMKGIGEVWDYASNPSKLINKVMGGLGINFDSIGGVMGNFIKWGSKKLKDGMVDLVTGWFESEGGGGGDGSSFTKFAKVTPYSPNSPVPGYPTAFNGGRHFGIDYATPSGTVLTAPTSGVVKAQSNHGGGTVARLLSGKVAQYFLHLSDILKTGRVKQGEKFAKTGNSGAWTTGPHLHYQVENPASGELTNKNTIDPEKFLSAKAGGGKSGKWDGDVRKALRLAGLPTTAAYVNAWKRQIQTESSGNPRAEGPGSSEGTPKGLVQVKTPTFNAYKLAGHGNIWNGLDNLIAGMRYAKATYGKTGLLNQIGHGLPYAKGTNRATAGLHPVFEKGGEIINFRGGEQVIPNDVSISAIKSVIQSDIFNKTQSAVYNAISEYADALREKEQAKYQAMMQQQVDTQTLQEQNSILKEMLYTMQDLVMSSRNNEKWNAQTANKSNAMDWDKVEGITSKKQGRRIQNMGYGNGGAFI
ncbi:tape measure protein [Mammaliicoccus sciuri]|uniref:tape measure protein n=1 Tax=Mammaliicoccus sciuri TaxID=1296 RepID=UPI00066BB46B|nr:tape measure protein [Mammaliicoccus sciuri]